MANVAPVSRGISGNRAAVGTLKCPSAVTVYSLEQA